MEHRAYCEQQPDGSWSGGCQLCGTSFANSDKNGAKSWVSGHNSAIACSRKVAEKVGPRFVKVGPGEAPTLGGLRKLIEQLEERFGDQQVEILLPADHIPALFLWSPPTRDGWDRDFLGAIYLDQGASFAAASPPQLTAADWYKGPRGWVAMFPGTAGLDPGSLRGRRVEIDGKPYTVLGVETHAVENTTGKPFGLLVGER